MLRRSTVAAAVAAVLVQASAGLAPAQPPITVQEAMLRAKPAVVLVVAEVNAEVTLNCGAGSTTVTPPVFRETGTGWFVDNRGWVVTNGHVVEPAHQPPKWLVNQQAQRAVTMACLPPELDRRGIEPGARPDVEDAIKRRFLDSVLPTTKVKLNSQVTVLISSGGKLKAEVQKYSPPLTNAPGAMSGGDLALLKIEGENYPVLPLADPRSARIGDPVHILGFPGVVLSHELLNASATVEATVTNGAVSGFKEDVAGQPIIQTDAPAAWGNSGGPAVDAKGRVLGVLTFVSVAPGPEGSLVQGFNFIIPSQAVRDFVQGTSVNLDGRSLFNDLWWSGLRDFFGDDWKRALDRFERANKLVPNLPDVKRLTGEAREYLKNPPPRPFPWFWVAVGITLVSAGGFGAQLFLRWQRNRYRVTPSEVVKLAEEGKAPLLLDMRRAETYDQLPLKIPGSIRVDPADLSQSMASLELDKTRPVVAYCT
jgi:S1-C subfamily serine protease